MSSTDAALPSGRTNDPGTARPVSTSSSRLRASKTLFLAAAGLSFLFSVTLWFLVDREQGLFVGLWVPSILSLGALLLAGREASDG